MRLEAAAQMHVPLPAVVQAVSVLLVVEQEVGPDRAAVPGAGPGIAAVPGMGPALAVVEPLAGSEGMATPCFEPEPGGQMQAAQVQAGLLPAADSAGKPALAAFVLLSAS